MPHFHLQFVQPNFTTCEYDGREECIIRADDMKDAWARGKLMEADIVAKNNWNAEIAGLAIVRSLTESQRRKLKRSGVPIVS